MFNNIDRFRRFRTLRFTYCTNKTTHSFILSVIQFIQFSCCCFFVAILFSICRRRSTFIPIYFIIIVVYILSYLLHLSAHYSRIFVVVVVQCTSADCPTPLPKEFFQRNTFVARCDFFVNARQVTKRLILEPATYVIIPSTFEPDVEASFLLRVFTETDNTVE